MAAFVSQIARDGRVAPTSQEMADMEQYDAGIGGVNRARFHEQPACVFPLFLPVTPSVGSGVTDYGNYWTAPFPCQIEHVQAGCDAAGGATGTVDVETDEAEAGTYVTCLEAAIDVKTTAGAACAVGSITSGKETISAGRKIRVKAVSGSGGAMTGTVAHLLISRL
jgi:hypothetical protein